MLSKLADEGFGRVRGETAGVVRGVHYIEKQLCETLAVFGGCGGVMKHRKLSCAFEAFAGELVEADGDGLPEIHGEMAGGFWGEEGDCEQQGAVAEVLVGEAGLFGAEEEGYAGLRKILVLGGFQMG